MENYNQLTLLHHQFNTAHNNKCLIEMEHIIKDMSKIVTHENARAACNPSNNSGEYIYSDSIYLACMLKGFKQITKTDFSSTVFQTLVQNLGFEFVILKYLKNIEGDELIVYTPENKERALLLYSILSKWNPDEKYDILEHDTIVGKCLGYSDEDIKYFLDSRYQQH